MDSPPKPACCLWQLLKKKKNNEPRDSDKSNSAYYGDWGIDENIDAVNSIFPKKKQKTLRKEKEKKN